MRHAGRVLSFRNDTQLRTVDPLQVGEVRIAWYLCIDIRGLPDQHGLWHGCDRNMFSLIDTIFNNRVFVPVASIPLRVRNFDGTAILDARRSVVLIHGQLRCRNVSMKNQHPAWWIGIGLNEHD